MRRSAPHLLFGFLLTGAVGAAAEPAQLSPRLTQIIRAASPKFTPPPPPAGPVGPVATEEKITPAPDDSDAIALPKFFVEGNRLARVAPDKFLSKAALAAKQRREYRASLTGLEWALNGFSIPFLTPSVAARAQAKYEDERRNAELSRLGSLLDVASRLDPKAAAELRAELLRR